VWSLTSIPGTTIGEYHRARLKGFSLGVSKAAMIDL